MLESYLSPYLLSYVNKYIKNIKPEDLQVSLWGGDLVLAKLDLRLDVLEKELGNLPLSFLSGQIHELKIHIPWTSLGSEPAVVTINTIQFVLKLKDGATSDTKSESTVSSRGGEEEESSDSRTKRPKSGASSELTPSYIQSLTRRIINNVHIVINNLILKYVEEDIVLSVNIKSVESFAVNGAWEKAFVELALPELVLRRLCIFSDVTVCLDKRNASGKIDVYQEPVIFHWNLTTRMHMTFESLHARVANVIKVSTFCEELHLSLSETQLPMYIRLVQLVLALYYGTIDPPDPGHAGKDSDIDEQLQKDPSAALSSLVEGQHNDEGWTSWAWSLVPEVFSYDDEEDEEEALRQRNNEDSIISVGFYCHQGSFTFKLSDISHTGGPFGSSRKLHIQPFLRLSGEGMSLEVTMQGLAFFNVQLGISHISALGLANCTCGVDDFNITLDDDREFLPFVTCGTENISEKEVNYLTGSLFDPVCPENHGKRGLYILDQEKHHEIFAEEYGIARFGAFWSDYVFTMSLLEEKDDSDSGSYSSVSGWDPIFTWREFSWKKFILSPCQVTISSSLVHRLQQLVFSAQNHEYEPYSREKPELVDENRPIPTNEQVAALEDHIPSRSTQFSLLDMDVKFLFAEHPPFTAGPNTLCEISDKEPPTSLALSELPSLHVMLKRLDMQTTVPMYARRLVKAVSKLPVPSSDLIHQCCSHFHLKIFGLEASLILVPISESMPDAQPMVERRLMEPVSAAAYQKTLALPVYWKDPSQVLNQTQVELPKITLNVTKPQMLLTSHLYQSWMTPTYESDWLLESSLVDDVFDATDNPVLEGSVCDVNVCFTVNQIVWAATGSVQQAQLSLNESSKELPTPMMQGPEETHHLPSEGRRQEDAEEALMSFTIQMKKENLKELGDDGLSAFFLNIRGIALCFDPGIFSWLTYQPRQKSSEGIQPLQHSIQHQLSQDSFQDNQGSSSPWKKLSRPVPKLQSLTDLQSVPEEVQEGSGTFVKKQLYSLSEKLQQIVIQVNIQPAILIILADTVNLRPNRKITDILVPTSSEEVRHLFAVRMPSLDIISSGHQHIDVSQDIPLDKASLPQDGGSKFPWTVNADSFEIFTVSQNVEPKFHLLEPLAIASTVAFNSHIDEDSPVPSVGMVVHTDMPGIQLNCSHEQVELLGKLCEQLTSHLPNIVDTFSVRPKWVAKSPGKLPRSLSTTNTRSMTKSSRTSSEHLQDTPITVSSPVESVSRDDVEDTDEHADHASIRLSLWIQWTVDKVGVSLITKKSEETGKRVKLSAVMEDLTTSVDYQDIFSKMTCKVGSLNIRHFEESMENSWRPGCYKGILFTSSHTLTKSLDSPSVTPRSPNLSRTRSLLRKSEHKFTDSKQSHSFFSLIWTRAKGISVSKRLEGKDVPWETSAKQKQFVNEFIVSMQPVDLVIWCPIIAEMLNTIQLSEVTSPPREEKSGTIQIQTPTPARAKPIIQTTPKTSHHKLRSMDTQSRSKAPSSTVSTFDKWFTSSFLPLLYFDIQEVRCFLPVQKCRDQTESAEMDLFLFKVSHVKLVPYADNPLPRMVMKKELFRKAQQGKGKPGTPMEDRQYQLDVSNLGLFTASWKDISRITAEEKRSTDPDIVASQNPALEWNTSPPNQDESVVHLNPVIQEFSICCIAAPAITVNRSNADKSSSKPVIVCGHSVEANIASDLSLYLSLSNITMAQNLMANNFGALAKCFPFQTRADDVAQRPPHHAKHRHSRADSGFDSDFSHRSHDYPSDTARQPNPTVDFTKIAKQKYKALPVKQQTKTSGQARKIIPFDLLLTGREISVFLFSQGKEDAVCPFLLSQLSQPSFAASVSKKRQKLELSLYNLRVCGSSQKEINGDLPSTADFFVPWLETSLGEPNAKTGVRPALLTLTVSDFLTGDGAIAVDVGRPVKVNFSIDKGEEAYSFIEKIRSKFQRKRQVWPQPEWLETDVQNNPFASGLPIQEVKDSSSDQTKNKPPDPLGPLAVIKNYSLATSHCAITIATGPCQENAQALFCIAGAIGNMKVRPNVQGLTKDLHLCFGIDGMAVKTGLNNIMRPLIGPVTYDCDTMVQLLHSDLTITKTVCHMSIGHIPVTLGQEHINCLTALVTNFRAFFQLDQKEVPVPPMQQRERKPSRPSMTPDPIHSKDDLRSESFVYITDSGSEQLCPNEIQFQPGGSGTTHDGSMTWRYPEPRVLTRITMTPIPLRTATNIQDDDDLSDVPCSLEYWDDMECCFHHYKDLFVSENNTYHVSMGLGQRSIGSDGAVAACLWRMVLNPGSDKRKRNLLAEQNIILTPMALAASLRVDSCFSPVFIPTTSLALKVGLIDVHLVNHLSQCGRATPEKLLPFTFDDTEPADQEFCTVSLLESTLSTQLWKIPSTAIKMKMQTNLKASVLNYSQLTMVPLISNVPIEGSVMVDQADGGCLIEMDTSDLNIRIGQGSVHVLTDALQSWINNKQPEAEQVVSVYYVLSNNTNVTLRLGQVDTDEVIILHPRKMHQYCWRTHKQSRQLLHLSIDDWNCSYWSEPFDIGREGATASCSIKHNGKEATIFVEFKAISSLQRQVIFHAQQSFVNHLTIPIEVHLQISQNSHQRKDHPLGCLNEEGSRQLEDALRSEGTPECDTGSSEEVTSSQGSESKPHLEGGVTPDGNSDWFLSIDADSSHPSLLVDEADIVGIRVKLRDEESDWSEQFAVAGEMMREKFVAEVPRLNKSNVYFCCSILEEVHDGKTQRAILFSPSFWIHNFLPHSLMMNLTCKKNPSLQMKEVDGFGVMTPLYHLNPTSPYFATFQLTSDTAPSNPAIPISFDSDAFVVLPKEPLKISDLLFMLTEKSLRNNWPFELAEFSQSNSTRQMKQPIISHPDTDLNIHLSQDWSHVDSLVINVEPWCLVANATEWDVTISDAGGMNCYIPAGTTIAPPKIQGKFSFSVTQNEKKGSTEMVTLQDEKISPFMRPDQMEKKQLFIDGYVSLEIPFHSEGSEDYEVCYLVVQSEIKENIRFIKIQPKVVILNDHDGAVALRAVEYGNTEKISFTSLKHLKRRTICPNSASPAIVWKRFISNKNQRQSPWQQSISIALININSTSDIVAPSDRSWSKWIHLDTAVARQPIPVPVEQSGIMQFATRPFVAVMHKEKGVVYISLGIDPCPQMAITNHCPFPLQLAQAVPGKGLAGCKVLEDTQPLPECTIVPPQQMAHYSYHTSSIDSEPVRIRLAVAPYFSAVQLPEINGAAVKMEPDWTDPIAIATTSSPLSEITALSTGSYVLVASHMTGLQTNISIELLSMDSLTNEKSGKETQKADGAEKTAQTTRSFQNMKAKIFFKSATLSLMDEVQNALKFVEILRLHAEGIHFLSYPRPYNDRKGQLQMFNVSVKSAQVDNQAHTSGRYDFPVIFKGKSRVTSVKKEVNDTNFAEMSDHLKEECFVAVCISTELAGSGKSIGWDDLMIHFNDAEVFIEDQFIFDMLHFSRSFPVVALKQHHTQKSRDPLPRNVRASLSALKGPISIQHLTIEPVTLLASVHASMKFFIAVDRTLLTFGQFQTGPVFATISQLGQALSLHYTSGAIFKAGWVLGSLEILGNPAGLLRSVSSGLADTILLPYEGLIRGPTAFISGVAGGLSSLVWQITAGTLTSITKFATSVSRNLDRLSLDRDHLLRQETARRRIPHGPAEGITQGLSHFGISLLGAIAGIADQPIRGFQKAGSVEGESHAGEQAKEVISGLGKGLVGAVVKPIGGAAELVSQTGQGILHGTGLAEFPKQLSMQHIELRAKFLNSKLKYSWKMFVNIPKPEILMLTKVTSVTNQGLHHAGALILTPQMLFVISISEDSAQQAFPLEQTECFPVGESEEGIRFKVKGAMSPLTSPEVPETSDLIADFVDVSSSFIGSMDEIPNTSLESPPDDEEEKEEIPLNVDSWTFTFFMNRHLRVTFLSIFQEAKKQLPKDRFLQKSF